LAQPNAAVLEPGKRHLELLKSAIEDGPVLDATATSPASRR
jgi:hypothetical protein